MSWEDVSVLPRKIRRDLNESEKLEIIQSNEIPPNDYSAEAVAKSLLHVGSFYVFTKSLFLRRFACSELCLCQTRVHLETKFCSFFLFKTFFIANFWIIYSVPRKFR